MYVSLSKRCYAPCGAGLLAFNSLCCPKCPTGFGQYNATHCSKATTPRQFVLRPSPCSARSGEAAPLQQTSRLVDQAPVDRECSGEGTLINGQCYRW